jgi:hypothetical protein
MGMTDEYDGYFFPFEIQLTEAYLRGFAAVEKKELSFPAEEHGGEISVGKGHHAPGSEYEAFHWEGI